MKIHHPSLLIFALLTVGVLFPKISEAQVGVDPEHYYLIESQSRLGQVLDVHGAKAEPGTNVSLYGNQQLDNQYWRFIPAGRGYYYIETKLKNGMILDIDNWGEADQTNIGIVRLGEGTSAQQFKVVDAGDGFVFLQSAMGEKFRMGVADDRINIVSRTKEDAPVLFRLVKGPSVAQAAPPATNMTEARPSGPAPAPAAAPAPATAPVPFLLPANGGDADSNDRLSQLRQKARESLPRMMVMGNLETYYPADGIEFAPGTVLVPPVVEPTEKVPYNWFPKDRHGRHLFGNSQAKVIPMEVEATLITAGNWKEQNHSIVTGANLDISNTIEVSKETTTSLELGMEVSQSIDYAPFGLGGGTDFSFSVSFGVAVSTGTASAKELGTTFYVPEGMGAHVWQQHVEVTAVFDPVEYVFGENYKFQIEGLRKKAEDAKKSGGFAGLATS